MQGSSEYLHCEGVLMGEIRAMKERGVSVQELETVDYSEGMEVQNLVSPWRGLFHSQGSEPNPRCL